MLLTGRNAASQTGSPHCGAGAGRPGIFYSDPHGLFLPHPRDAAALVVDFLKTGSFLKAVEYIIEN